MADQEPPSGGESSDSAEQGKSGGPSRPPPTSGTPPMTPTRARLGSGRGASPAKPPAQAADAGQSAKPPTSPEEAAAPRVETPAPRPAQAEGAQPSQEQPAQEPAAEADELPTEPRPPARLVGAAPAAQGAAGAQPAHAASGDGDGARAAPPASPAQTAAPARPAAAAAAPARPAAAPAGARTAPAAAARPAGATAERLAAAVKKEPAPTGGGAAEPEKLVYVWPHLVTVEFLSALLMLLSMIVLSWIVNAPLEAHANPDRTPNPSKAPWYFLNLQELLLHMHPALAGVLVPAGALTLIAAIPYIDRDTTDLGKWFGTKNAVAITIFVTIYTTLVEVALIFFDEYIGVKPLMTQLAAATGINYLQEVTPFGIALFSIPNVIVPTALMLGPIVPMMLIIWRLYKPNTREVMIALFTGFVVSYVILTIFGTFFRGQGMHLFWPWDPNMIRVE